MKNCKNCKNCSKGQSHFKPPRLALPLQELIDPTRHSVEQRMDHVWSKFGCGKDGRGMSRYKTKHNKAGGKVTVPSHKGEYTSIVLYLQSNIPPPNAGESPQKKSICRCKKFVIDKILYIDHHGITWTLEFILVLAFHICFREIRTNVQKGKAISNP